MKHFILGPARRPGDLVLQPTILESPDETPPTPVPEPSPKPALVPKPNTSPVAASESLAKPVPKPPTQDTGVSSSSGSIYLEF